MTQHAIIRRAAPGDAVAIASLAGQLGYPAATAVMAERLQRAMTDASRIVAAAEVDGIIVGCMEVAVSEAFETGRWSEIRGLIVAEGARSAGVGAKLVEFAKHWTRDQGLKTLRVRTNETRTRAHSFYERNGFTKTKSQRVYDVQL